MTYNTNTKLLLNFNGSDGAGTTADTAQGAHAVTLNGAAQISSTQGKFSTNALRLGNPDGTGAIGTLSVDSPGDLFSDNTALARRFDFWFYRDANSPWGNAPLLALTFQNGDTIALWRAVTNYQIEINSANTDGGYTYQSVTNYDGYQTWVHLRLLLFSDTLYLGLNGSEVMTASQSSGNDLWLGGDGNPVTSFRIGGNPIAWGTDANAFMRGYLDAYEVTEDDMSWTGGSYTIPTAAPDDYSGGGGSITGSGANTLEEIGTAGTGIVTVVINGAGTNTLDALASTGTGTLLAIISGTGTNTLDAMTGTGTGVTSPVILGTGTNTLAGVVGTGTGTVRTDSVGANTVENVTSTGTGLLGNDLYTTLMLHGNTAGLTADSSIYAQTTIAQNIAQSYATPLYGDGAMGFSNPSGGTGGSQIRLDLTGALFANPTQDKIIDFSLAQDPTEYTGGDVFRLDFPVLGLYSASNSYIRFETNTEFLRARLYVLTPNTNSLLTLALPAANARIRVAFIGSNLYVCYNGVQVGTLAGEGAAPYTLWPQTVACSSFVIGGNATSFKGKLDEFRIQEGSVTNHGYAGGNYTVDTAEWCPLRMLGAGSNTVEAITSTGSGTVAPVIYGTSSTQLQDVTGDGWGSIGVFIQGTGTQTLEDVTSLGLGVLGAIVYGTGTSVVEDIVSGSSSGAFYWAGRGSSTLDSIIGTGEGVVGAGVSTNNGANTVQDVISTGAGSILIQGSGAVTIDVSSSGIGTASTQGYGANTVAVGSLGVGVIPMVGVGSNVTSVLSSGDGAILLQGYGQSSVDVFSSAQGFILITGHGANTLDDIYTFVEDDPLAEYVESVSVFLPPHRGHVRTSTPSFWIRQ